MGRSKRELAALADNPTDPHPARERRTRSGRHPRSPTRFTPDQPTQDQRHSFPTQADGHTYTDSESLPSDRESQRSDRESQRRAHSRHRWASHSRTSHSRLSHSRSHSREPHHPGRSRDTYHGTSATTIRREMAEVRNTVSQEINDLKDSMALIHQTLQHMHPPATPSSAALSQSPTPTQRRPIPATSASLPSTSLHPSPSSSHTGNDVNVMQTFLPMPRPIITAGIGITAHLQHTIKEKIWKDEYVQLSTLLPQQSHHHVPETVTLSLYHENHNVGVKVNKPKPTQITIQQWEDAFLVYMAVYTERHNTCPAMCTYARDVKDMARRGGNFQYYDEQYRIERATTHCTWDTVHQGLLFQATTPFRTITPFRSNTKSQSKGIHNSKVPKGHCIDYHTPDTFCKAHKCRYKHDCYLCEERHPAFRCPARTLNKRDPATKTDVPSQRPKPNFKDANAGQSK